MYLKALISPKKHEKARNDSERRKKYIMSCQSCSINTANRAGRKSERYFIQFRLDSAPGPNCESRNNPIGGAESITQCTYFSSGCLIGTGHVSLISSIHLLSKKSPQTVSFLSEREQLRINVQQRFVTIEILQFMRHK